MRRGRAQHITARGMRAKWWASIYAVPFQTVTETGFSDQSAVTDTNSAQHQVNDGNVANDADFLKTGAAPSSAHLRFKLSPFIMPVGDLAARLRVKKA